MPTRFVCLLVFLLGATAVVTAGDARAQVPADPEITAARLLVRGMTRAFLGDDDGALEHFEQILQIRPDDATAHAAIAGVLVRKQDLVRASFFAERAASLAPDRAENHRLVAELRGLTGDPVGSLAAYDRLVALVPGDLSGQVARAQLLVSLEQRSAALEAFRTARQIAPLPANVLREFYAVELSLGELDGALSTLDELLAIQSDVEFLMERGKVLVMLDRSDEAADAFEAVLRADSEWPGAREALAAADPSRQGPVEISEPSADRAARLTREADENVRSIDFRLRAIDANLSAGHLEEADRLVEDGQLFFPGNASLLARTVDLRLHQLSLEATVELLDDWRSDDPSSELVAAGQGAVEWLSSGTPSQGQSPTGVRARAWAAIGGSDVEVLLDQEIPSSKVARAVWLARTQGAAEGARFLQDNSPASPLELLILGDLLNQAGQRSGAVSAWQQALTAAPENPLLLSRLR